jgi:hypothetical protein
MSPFIVATWAAAAAADATIVVYLLYKIWLHFSRRPRCYICHIRTARIETGDYPLCRECYRRIESEARIVRALDELATHNIADDEIRQYFREERRRKP